VTGCDFLWAVCGERGAVCRAVCGVCAGGVRAVMFAQSAVVAAVRDVVRACGTCVFVCCVCECGVRCVACWCALFLGDTRHDADVIQYCGGWGLSRRVCLCARDCVV
jgi:hypothetical protein